MPNVSCSFDNNNWIVASAREYYRHNYNYAYIVFTEIQYRKSDAIITSKHLNSC